MRKVRKEHRDEPPNLTPVVNVAMVVLVVFMLTASFIEPQPYMPSRVALLAEGGASSYDADDLSLKVMVDVDPATPSQFTAIVGGVSATEDAALRGLFESQASALRGAGDDPGEAQVEISPQRAVIWQHLITVYQAAQLAGFTNITFTPAR